MTLPRVLLKPRRAQPFYGRHPWVFVSAIASVVGDPADGDEVALVADGGDFIARGFYNSQSKIRLRLYSWDPELPLDQDFFRQRIAAAIRLRRTILNMNPHASLAKGREGSRLVFSEGDGLSGLTVDRYDRWMIVQFTSMAMATRRDMLADVLMELTGVQGIYLRTERGIGQKEGLNLQDGLLRGQVPTEPIEMEEHGVRFLVNLTEGQKTGFYLDQRDNRQVVSSLAADRRVLDAFCYTGGFGLHAAKAGAREVLGVDVSEPALLLARANAELNGFSRATFTRADVFGHLIALARSQERFGMVILDPPKFARSRGAVADALAGYRRLYGLGIQLLETDGILVVCCCSGLITREMLEGLLARLAADHRRDIQILYNRGQAPDHPSAATCPESNYLKCLICRVK